MDIKWIQIYQMVTTLLLLLWRLGESVQQEYEEITSSACFNQKQKALILNCSQGYMVKLNKIFYGYASEPNSCSYKPGQCIMDLPETELYPCIGRSQCQINLPSGGSGKIIPKCQQFGTYAQANYQCIPDTSVIDICNPPRTILQAQSGYIATPRYPNNYPDNQVCSLKIQTPHATQRIRLYIIDLNLEKNETDCSDWLHIFDDHRGQTYCATRARMGPLTLMDNTIELTFNSNSKVRKKGFWLYYEAYPYIDTTTTESTLSTKGSHLASSTVKEHGHNQPDITSRPISIHKLTDFTTTGLPVTVLYSGGTALTVGAIIGVVVSFLLVLTVIILVILLCKRKDHSSTVKVPSSMSCNSEAAFLHISNNCYAPTRNSQSPGSLPPLSPSDYVHMQNNQHVVNNVCDNYINDTGVGTSSSGKVTDESVSYYNNKPYAHDVV